MDPVIARRTWRTLEPVHGMIYFTPHASSAYAAIGVTGGRMGYFGSRVAPLGAASAELTIATFFNFQPALVRRSIPAVWELTTPAAITTARLAAVDVSLRQAFGDELLASATLAETVELAEVAAREACEATEGRPLFAGHASLDWPDEPHLRLWHAQTLLREFRGDGHIAALVNEGLGGIDALISHAASGDIPETVLRATRAWSDAEWDAGVESMVERGLIERTSDGFASTEAGRAQRERIESTTDRLATRPYARLGEDGCARLRDLGRPLSQAVIAAGLLNVDPQRFAD